jgi:hypothetical protein
MGSFLRPPAQPAVCVGREAPVCAICVVFQKAGPVAMPN